MDSLIPAPDHWQVDLSRGSVAERFSSHDEEAGADDFLIVYNESQFTDITPPARRGLVAKYTQLFAY